MKKAQQRLYFLHQVRTFNLPQELLIQFYSAIIESVLCTSITVWFSSATKSDLRRLRRVVRTAERIIGTTHSPGTVLIQSEQKGWKKITLDPHIQHTPSLNCYRLVDCYRSSEHQNGQTQKQFLPSSNPSHEHLTLIMVHTLFIRVEPDTRLKRVSGTDKALLLSTSIIRVIRVNICARIK